MKKVAIIGAGNVGGTTAMRIAEHSLANVVLIDVVENVAKAKACDVEDSRYSLKHDSRIEGTSDITQISGSDIIIITAGFPRTPGMKREELIAKNAEIMTGVCENIVRFSKGAIVIVVSNPLDVMTYLAYKKTGLAREKVFGMGSSLDSARFANLIAKKLLINTEFVEALVIGSHGETMIPMPRLTKVRRRALTEIMNESDVADLVNRTRQRGAEIVGLYGKGSAYIGPSAAIYEIVEAIILNLKKEIPVSVCLEGEYNLHDVSIGVPAKIGSAGIEKIIELGLTTEEKDAFIQSAESVKDAIKTLNL